MQPAIPESQAMVTDEFNQLLRSWNDTQTPYPSDQCIHQLFERRAAETPNATAVVCGGQRLTYRDLNRRSNQLARYLQKRGIEANTLVGICMHRCPEMIISVLGTLKAGGAYVPLDPAYPEKRLAAMLKDANLKVVLIQGGLLGGIPAHMGETICVDRDWKEIDAEADDNLTGTASVNNLCYVIFTSGSTGAAKAAAVYHRGWTNLVNWFVTEFNVGSSDRELLVSSFSFDITQRSIAMPLISGAELHLLTSVSYDPALILQVIADQQITLMNCAPSTFYPLVENTSLSPAHKLSSLRVLFLGGEAISASRLREWAEQGRTEIVNVYGAAECSDVSSFYRLKDCKRYAESSVPIGKPIFNTRMYLLDQDLTPVAFGAPGEICISGDGVGRGYINDAPLTAEKFVRDPFSEDPRSLLYRTGDLGRFLPGWNLEFIGRVDHQIKLRGLRIDLGEIEVAIRQLPIVREAIVLFKGYGPSDQRLVAYVTSRNASASREEIEDRLRPFLKERLPEYMVPGEFFRLDEMPLSPNGKIDRNALLNLEITGSGLRIGPEEPRNPIEKEVALVFAKALKLARVGIYDNFFNLGGNSYLLTEVIIPLSVSFQVGVSIGSFLDGPTVAQVAGQIEAAQAKK